MRWSHDPFVREELPSNAARPFYSDHLTPQHQQKLRPIFTATTAVSDGEALSLYEDNGPSEQQEDGRS